MPLVPHCDCVVYPPQAEHTLAEYRTVKSRLAAAQSDSEEMERRADRAGLCVLETEARVEGLRGEVEELEAERQRQEQLLQDIRQVIYSYWTYCVYVRTEAQSVIDTQAPPSTKHTSPVTDKFTPNA